MNTRNKILFFCLISISFIGCDRITKTIAKEHLMNKPSYSYFNDMLRLEYTENTGAAFGFGDNLNASVAFWFLGIFPLVALLGMFLYMISKSKDLSPLKLFAASLIISGGLGNIIDRLIFHRHVTDFLNVGMLNIRTQVFNVADMCVTFGVLLLVVIYFKKPKTA